jgi:hypothetical protein
MPAPWVEAEQADVERRAALYREQQQHRIAFQTWLWRLRKGSVSARATLMVNWDPVIRALQEQAIPTVEPELDPYYDPLQQREQVNVGT